MLCTIVRSTTILDERLLPQLNRTMNLHEHANAHEPAKFEIYAFALSTAMGSADYLPRLRIYAQLIVVSVDAGTVVS